MNRIEDSQSILYIARAFDKSNKQTILEDQEIPKSTRVALLVFNTSDAPVNARVGLANLGHVKRIESQQKKKFSFVTSQNCTLRDVRLNVESDASEKLDDTKGLEEKEEKSSQENNSPNEAFVTSQNSKLRDVGLNVESDASEKLDETMGLEEKEEKSSQENNSPNEAASSVAAPDTPPTTRYINMRVYDLDDKKYALRKGLIPGHKLALRFKNPNEAKIKLVCSVVNSHDKKMRIFSHGVPRNNSTEIDPKNSHDFGYIIPRRQDGNHFILKVLMTDSPAVPGGPLYFQEFRFPILTAFATVGTCREKSGIASEQESTRSNPALKSRLQGSSFQTKGTRINF